MRPSPWHEERRVGETERRYDAATCRVQPRDAFGDAQFCFSPINQAGVRCSRFLVGIVEAGLKEQTRVFTDRCAFFQQNDSFSSLNHILTSQCVRTLHDSEAVSDSQSNERHSQ